MTETLKFRLARPSDAAELVEIYGPYVEKTAFTFETVVPSVDIFIGRVEKTLADYPFLVVEEAGRIIGYAYASHFSERAAYDWVVELSVYLDIWQRHQGIGKQLYRRLFAILELQGIRKFYASMTRSNSESIGFHQSLGFREVGRFEDCGYKFGKWHSVVFLELAMNQDEAVEPVRWFRDLPEAEIRRALAGLK